MKKKSSTQSPPAVNIHSENSLHVLLLMWGQHNYKQRRRTPLLFLTGRSPEVIFFPLPWNKSMKHNSLWTIAHLPKSDVGWGASHHRSYSVCWQRRTLINKARSLKQVPEHEFSFERQFRKAGWLEDVCYSACNRSGSAYPSQSRREALSV